MEKKTFRIVKNILWPFKSTIEIGPDGISNNGKMIKWEDMTAFSCSITSINKAMNYIIACDQKEGKGIYLNFIVAITGSKKKKRKFAEIYDMAHEGFTKHLIMPKSQNMFDEIQAGKEITVAGAMVSKNSVVVTKGMMKKEKITIPLNEIELQHPSGTGGFRIASTQNKKDYQHFDYGGGESRYLLALLEKMLPEQAQLYAK